MKKTYINIETILAIIFVIVFSVTMWIVIQIAILKVDVPSIFGYRILRVVSGSMKGTLEVGDLIVIKEYSDENQVKKEDIITFKRGQTYITHRIVGSNRDITGIEYITKGDANGSNDINYVTYREIEGKYVFTVPLFGKILTFMQRSYEIKVVFILPIFLIIFILLKDKKEERLSARRREKRIRYEYEKKLKGKANC